MSDMIDYDDLRKKADIAKWRQSQYEHRYELYHPESAEFLYSGPRWESAGFELREALSPDVAVRLLRIIKVAKDGLEAIKARDEHHGKIIALVDVTLAEIAKIEGEG